MADNMAIWNAVSQTDPDHTKEVSFGRKFTAIDAHSQVMEATRQFGPIGTGWGFKAAEPIFHGDLVTVPVTLWHDGPENTFGPLYGAATVKDSKGKYDTDCLKKATTDGITKGLSLLGFNADVFLGKFDDNKYVQSLKQQKEPPKKQLSANQQAKRDAVKDNLPNDATPQQKAEAYAAAIAADIEGYKNAEFLEQCWQGWSDIIDLLKEKSPDVHVWLLEQKDNADMAIQKSEAA